jgi:hypothetical protein
VTLSLFVLLSYPKALIACTRAYMWDELSQLLENLHSKCILDNSHILSLLNSCIDMNNEDLEEDCVSIRDTLLDSDLRLNQDDSLEFQAKFFTPSNKSKLNIPTPLVSIVKYWVSKLAIKKMHN